MSVFSQCSEQPGIMDTAFLPDTQNKKFMCNFLKQLSSSGSFKTLTSFKNADRNPSKTKKGSNLFLIRIKLRGTDLNLTFIWIDLNFHAGGQVSCWWRCLTAASWVQVSPCLRHISLWSSAVAEWQVNLLKPCSRERNVMLCRWPFNPAKALCNVHTKHMGCVQKRTEHGFLMRF